MIATTTVRQLVRRSRRGHRARDCDEGVRVLAAPTIQTDADGAQVPPTGLVDHAPIVYRLTQRKALAMATHALHERERELRRLIDAHRREGAYCHLDWVRLHAVRHVLEDRGETLEAL